jgi:hypothetical protein
VVRDFEGNYYEELNNWCKMMRVAIFFLSLLQLLFVGCSKWAQTGAPDITGANALESVNKFVATNGWNSYSETNTSIFWAEAEPSHYITGLPWKHLTSQQFPALTSNGILYVLLADEFHADYIGLAYNPHTNHFPEWIRKFQPVGNHWYVWAQPEFWATSSTDGKYE